MQPDRDGAKPLWRHVWREVGSGTAKNIVSTIIASAVIAAVAAVFVDFSHVTSSDSAAFRILLASAVIAALAAALALVFSLLHAHRMADVNRRMADQFAWLANRIPSIDWSFDAAEHDRNVYERIRRVVENPKTMEFKVLTVFRDARPEEMASEQRHAIKEYYKSLEFALQQRRGFSYERLVVLRPGIGHERSVKELMMALLLARPDFVDHSRWLLSTNNLALGARADLRFYGDTGRLYDIAFAVALDDQRRPLTLILEIGTTRRTNGSARSEHPVLGLLALENPSSQLADAFLLDHQSLRSERMVVDHVADEVVREILGLN